MTVASANLVPELQHNFYTFVVESAINKYQVPFPVDIPELYQPQNSFIELLFNKNYTGITYEYRYVENSGWGTVPVVAVDRLNLYPGSGKYMELDASGDNFFTLKSDDFTMLDSLLRYRIDSTSLTMVDTTGSTALTFDSTSNTYILQANYNSLSTPLSKLIYLYLDLKLRGNTDKYNNTTLVCVTLLEACYEALVMDEYFKTVTGRGT